MITTLRAKRIIHFLIFYYLTQTTSTFKIIDVNDLPKASLKQNFENEFDFKDISAEYSRLLDYNEIENKNLNLDDNSFRNKKLVKRLLPHGISPTGLEYDPKFDTVYKPLVRIHKTKSINQFLNENTPNEDPQHERVIFVLPNEHKHKKIKLNYDSNDVHLKKPFVNTNSFDFNDQSKLLKLIQERNKTIKEPYQESERSKHNYNLKDKRVQTNKFPYLLDAFERSENTINYDDYKLKILKEAQKNIRGIKSKSKRLMEYAKVINLLKNILRSPQFDKSGEAIDPFAPEQQILKKEDKQKQHNKWMPHYPPWNYWTYKKTIHEDVCPGTQVKIGNMCIWSPPH